MYQLTEQPFPQGIWDDHEQHHGTPQPPDMPPKWKSSYDPYSKKESIMKPLFQFTTVKPTAEVIWNTLSTHDSIVATFGYTTDVLKFYMFVVLQLHTDFKSAKELCNNYEARTVLLGRTIKDLLDLPPAQSSSSLRVPPADLPQWVSPELYTPYYMLKQLNIEPTSTLWFTLFDRTKKVPTTAEEYQHLLVDIDPISESITAYKLWYYGNDIIAEKYSDIFAINDDFTPELVSTSADILLSLSQYMYDHLEDSDNHIYDYSSKISIKPFKIGVSDASQ